MIPVTIASFCGEWNTAFNTTSATDTAWTIMCNTTPSILGQVRLICNRTEPACGKCDLTESHGTDWLITTTAKSKEEWDIATNDFRMYFQIINFVFICQIIDLFGTTANIMNIVCFVKQGLRDPVNISFLGLTISDLLCLVTLVWQNISVNPLLYETDIPFDPEQTVYLTAGVPHLAFTRVTGWVTAFITLERCLCVTHPLKVKNVFTQKRVIFILICIYVLIISSNLGPAYYTIPFGEQRHPYLNRTWIGLVFTKYRRPIERYTFGINGILVPFCAFSVVVICTIILVVKLQRKTKWRKKSTAPGQSDSISSRDRSVSKMVVTISSIFIVCYFPVCVISIAMIIEPKLSIDGTFGNAFAIVFSFVYLLESVNASFNIFVYYRVSSRYKAVFRQTFCGDKTPGNTISIRDTLT